MTTTVHIPHEWKSRGKGLRARRVCAHCNQLAESDIGSLNNCPVRLEQEVARLTALLPPLNRPIEVVKMGEERRVRIGNPEPSDHVFDGFVNFHGPGWEGGATVRDCLDCGCLVPGGPTRCRRCARDATAKRPS